MLAASIDAFVVPSAGNQGDTIAMSAQASTDVSGASLTYTWDFGDGTQQSGVDLTDVSHAYAVPSPSGSPYTVTLTVDDGDQPATATSSITIDDVPPILSAGPSQTAHAGDSVQFNGSASDAGGPGQIASIQWDFNYNGSTFNPDASADGELTPSYTYTTPGTYVVAMQATDQSGAVSQDFTTVSVKPADALIVNAGSDLTVTAGQNVTLSGSYSDPDGTVTSSGIAWDTNYNGSTFNSTVTGTLTPTVSFSTPGSYQVALQITDSSGASDLSVLNVTVQPVSYTGPTANAGTDQTINEGDTASFNGSYTDPDGTVSASGIAWDFNYDGVSFNPTVTGTLTPSYQFTTPGDYTVALQITDSNGMTSLSTLDVTVNAVPPTVSAGTNLTVTAGQLVQFNGSASIPSGANDPLSYAWDFNYDGQNFNPGSASMLNPYNVFATPGTYTVALQATDGEGVSSLSTITVTVNPSNALVVNAGSDQALSEGDTASFSASYSDGSGTVDPATAQWDFNYDGQNFVANPSANGTLTPSYQFTTPGVYLVAVQLTDSNGVSSIGVQYVSVGDVDPDVDAGADQTVNQGDTVQFAGTASVPSGANDPLTYAWDFDYDGNNFVAVPNSNTLTPTYAYTTPGTYEAALQVIDAYGQVSLSTVTVTVNDVAPTATVTNSGPANAGSPVTFTVSNVQDLTPGDTPTYLVDWDGSGQFEELTSDEMNGNPDSSFTFTHNYDAPGNYNAVVRILDGSGGYTDYITNVVVNDVAPTVGYFGPSGGNWPPGPGGIIDATVPIIFLRVSDPSLADTLAGFTYYVSLDGGAYTSSTSPYYYLPGDISQGSNHTVSGYVEDSAGQTSPVYTHSFVVTAPQTYVENGGSGQIELDWTGAPEPVVVNANSIYGIASDVSGLTITLLTSGANYSNLVVCGNIALINAAPGVQDVNLWVSTAVTEESGDGDIGEIDLPAGSTLTVVARGDLGSIVGPSNDGEMTGSSATSLTFANLTGSITGLDYIGNLTALNWLGTSASQVIDVAAGIGSLSAYGVGATVIADARQDAGDPVMTVTVGDGGVPGVIEGGNVGNVSIAGNVNVFEAQNLEGNFDPLFERLVEIGNVTNKNLQFGYVGNLVFTGKNPVVNSIRAGILGGLFATNSLTVSNLIEAGSIGQIKVAGGNLNVGQGNTKGLIVSGSTIGPISVGGSLFTNGGKIAALGNISSITVANNLTGGVISALGNIGSIEVSQGNFEGFVDAEAGNTGPIKVGGYFRRPGTAIVYLVQAPKGTIGDITVGGNLGGDVEGNNLGVIEGESIGTIQVTGDEENPRDKKSILLSRIKATNGDIEAVRVPNGDLKAAVQANGGDIISVKAQTVEGNITARASDNLLIVGGSIHFVQSAHFIPRTVTISAEWYIGKIEVDLPSTAVPEQFTVKAEAGATWANDNATVAPLVLDIGGSNQFADKKSKGFLGEVLLHPSNRIVAAGVADYFQNGDGLLTLMTKTATTTWTVKGPEDDITAVDALFTELRGGIFGLVTNNKRHPGALDPQFSIQGGPSGKE
ncbi:MAG TPA: PKD domain-containing protein [Gemmataceae bacterium]